MPEGDTLFKVAARLKPALQGHVLTRFEAPRLRGDAPKLGERITLVEARGKHLLVHFDGGLVLRTHLRMTGSWHVYRERERWQKPAYLARAVVGADSGWVGVCFQAPVVETFHRAGAEPAALAGLGPDLCLPASLERRRDRRGARAGRAAGRRRARPWARRCSTSGSRRASATSTSPRRASRSGSTRARRSSGSTTTRAVGVWTVAARQLQANLGQAERRTHPAGLAVYGRRGQPCHRCGTPVQMARQGEQARSTYWCPTCQPPPFVRDFTIGG